MTAVAPVGHDESRKKVMRVLTEKEFRTMQVVPEQGRVIRVRSEFPILMGSSHGYDWLCQNRRHLDAGGSSFYPMAGTPGNGGNLVLDTLTGRGSAAGETV